MSQETEAVGIVFFTPNTHAADHCFRPRPSGRRNRHLVSPSKLDQKRGDSHSSPTSGSTSSRQVPASSDRSGDRHCHRPHGSVRERLRPGRDDEGRRGRGALLRVDMVHVFIPTSEVQRVHTIKKSREQVLERP